MAETYDLVFKAELVKGVDLVQAKRNMAQLFKIDAPKVEALFAGKPVVLKKGLDFDTASKYRAAIKKAGCRVDLVERAPANKAPETAAPKPMPPAAVQNHSTSEPARRADLKADFGLAAPGAPVLGEDERATVTPVNIDVSDLSVRDVGSDLLDEAEKAHFEKRDIALEASLAPLGADLLAESEREPFRSVAVDVSKFSVAEPGARLEQLPDDKQPLKPDTSHLRLV